MNEFTCAVCGAEHFSATVVDDLGRCPECHKRTDKYKLNGVQHEDAVVELTAIEIRDFVQEEKNITRMHASAESQKIRKEMLGSFCEFLGRKR